MNRKQIHVIAKAYLGRNSKFEGNNNIGIARSRESLIKKYIANRNRQLGTFLTDALSLKDIIFEEETPCENPRFASGAVEYYVLDLIQLENYFTFRTLVKRGELPTNNHPSFLVLYLMEIINGIYGNEYKDKRKKLDSVGSVFSKGAKFKTLIQEAYEILYLQNISNLNKEEYLSGVNFPLFKDTSLIANAKDASDVPLEDIFKIAKLEKFTAINSKDKFILRDSFEYLYKELNDEDDEFEIGGYKTVKSLFSFDYKLSFDSPLNKLKAYYPITTNIRYTNKKGNQEVIADGIHVTRKVYYDDYKLFQINKFLTLVVNSIQHICGGIPLPKQQGQTRDINSFFVSREESAQDLQQKIDRCVEKWVMDNPYAKKGYLLSLETLKNLKERGSFKLDISDVSKVRKQSSDIQEKLIIDDADATPIIIPKKRSNPFVENSLHEEDDPIAYFNTLKAVKSKQSTLGKFSPNDENEFTALIRGLASWEREIIRLLFIAEVAAAEDVASRNGKMLSLVVDEINTKSNFLIGDVIIIDNEIVEDYKEDLIQALG